MKISSKLCSVVAALATAGLGVTTVIATKKSIDKINLLKKLRDTDKLSKKEIVRECYKDYIVPASLLVVSVGSVVGANIIDAKAQAALTASLIALKKSYGNLDKAVEKVFGIDGKHAVTKELIKLSKNDEIPKEDGEETYFIGYGYDEFFKCTPDKIDIAEYKLNRKLRLNNTASVADFFEFLGIEPNIIAQTNGWGRHEVFNDLDDRWLEVIDELFEYDNGEQCHALSFSAIPSDTFEETDKWYDVGQPFDRDVPFDLNPTYEELEASMRS